MGKKKSLLYYLQRVPERVEMISYKDMVNNTTIKNCFINAINKKLK